MFYKIDSYKKYTQNMKNLLLTLLSLGSLLSSILVITSKNPIIAVTFLILVFINAGVYLLVLGVGFVGISYIIVYVGAITVLFLFVIMMINIKLADILEIGSQYTKNLPLALMIGSLFIFTIYTIIPFSTNNLSIPSETTKILIDYDKSLLHLEGNDKIHSSNFYNYFNNLEWEVESLPKKNEIDKNISNFEQIESLGEGLYTYTAIFLIITGIILLLAMIAPIFISRLKK